MKPCNQQQIHSKQSLRKALRMQFLCLAFAGSAHSPMLWAQTDSDQAAISSASQSEETPQTLQVDSQSSITAGFEYSSKPAGGIPNPLSLDFLLSELPAQFPDWFAQQAKIQMKQADLAGLEAEDAMKVDLQGRLSRREFVEESQNHNLLALHFGKSLYNFGYTDGLLASLQSEVEAESAFQGSLLNLHKFNMMQAFFNVILADFQFRIDNEQMAIEYISFDKSKDRHEVGQISDVEMIQAESNYQQALLQRSKSEQNQLRSRVNLANVIGYANARPDEMRMPSLKVFAQRDPKALNLEQLYAQLEQSNPELLRIQALINAQQAKWQAVQKSNYPEVRTDAWVGQLSSQPEVREGSWRVDLSMSMPLYDGGQQKSEGLQVQAKQIKLAADYQSLAQNLRQEVADVYFQLKLLEAEKEANQRFGDYADLYLDFSRALYENEQATDLGTSMVRLSEANYRVVAWRFKQALLWSKLDLLLGKPIQLTDPAPQGS